MEKLGFFKRLGSQIILIMVAALAIVVALVLVISITQFRSFTNGLLQARSETGERSLEVSLDDKIGDSRREQIILSKETQHMIGTAAGNAEAFRALAEAEFASDPDTFGVLADESGRIVAATANTPFANLDLSAVAKGSAIKGVVKADGALFGLYAAQAPMGGGSCVIAVGFLMETTEWMDEIKEETGTDVTIFNGNLRYSTTLYNAQGQRNIGTAMDSKIENTVINGHQTYHGDTTIGGKHFYVTYSPLYDYTGSVVGAYFSGSDATDADKEFSTVTWIAIAIGIAGVLAVAVVIFFFTQKKVVRPIDQVSVLADEMSRGQLHDTGVDYRFNEDEIGIFAKKLIHTKEQTSSYINDISHVLAAMGEGDFTQKPRVQYNGDFIQIQRSFEEIERRLSQIVGNMDASADGVRSGAGQIANGSQLLAEGTTRQATAIEEINATVANISKQVTETADNSNHAMSLSSGCLQKVEEQNEQMNSMLAAMDEIRDKSAKISEIIKTIEDIAFQTNILSLNASVEAARAGSAGKGFAVVADEVRNLANKSADAASNTNLLISDTVKAVNEGVELARSTAGLMGEVIEQTKQTNDIIGQINHAAVSQADAINQVSIGISDISGVISQNSATAEETAASCEELASQSNLLKEQVDMFKV